MPDLIIRRGKQTMKLLISSVSFTKSENVPIYSAAFFFKQTFWDNTLCLWLGGHRRFEGTYCLHLHGSRGHSQTHIVTSQKAWILKNNATRTWNLATVVYEKLTLQRPVVTICTASFNIQQFYLLSTQCYMCFVWIWEQTAIISLCSINWPVFINEI